MSDLLIESDKATVIAANTSPDMRPAVIVITKPLNERAFMDGDAALKKWGEFAEFEAEKLFQALLHSLPGGVLDQLTAKFLQRKVSLLQVKG